MEQDWREGGKDGVKSTYVVLDLRCHEGRLLAAEEVTHVPLRAPGTSLRWGEFVEEASSTQNPTHPVTRPRVSYRPCRIPEHPEPVTRYPDRTRTNGNLDKSGKGTRGRNNRPVRPDRTPLYVSPSLPLRSRKRVWVGVRSGGTPRSKTVGPEPQGLTTVHGG